MEFAHRGFAEGSLCLMAKMTIDEAVPELHQKAECHITYISTVFMKLL
jgi:hypothetical protein